MPSTIRTSDIYSTRFPQVPYIRRISILLVEEEIFLFNFLATNYNSNAPYKKSVEDITEETRYILEEFIIERAAEDGVDMRLVKPIIDVDLTARRFSEEETKDFNDLYFSSSTISTNSTDSSTFTHNRR